MNNEEQVYLKRTSKWFNVWACNDGYTFMQDGNIIGNELYVPLSMTKDMLLSCFEVVAITE